MFPIRDHNPSTRMPYVTWALIVVNATLFLLMLPAASNDVALWQLYRDWALVPARTAAGLDPYTLVTSQFLHAGFLHLAGNMLFLWIFGDNLEDQFGPLGFLAFYLACGIAAAGAQIWADPGSQVPMVGASGAIAGVMGGYLLLFPKARVDVVVFFGIFFRVVPLPARAMLGLWFAIQLVLGFADRGGAGGVAYMAHVGGFAAGLALTFLLWQRRGGTGFWQRTEGHPPHPEYVYRSSGLPKVPRR
jgi:membrane associated rhomboid family serine protease